MKNQQFALSLAAVAVALAGAFLLRRLASPPVPVTRRAPAFAASWGGDPAAAKSTLDAWTFPGVGGAFPSTGSDARGVTREFDVRAPAVRVWEFYSGKAGYPAPGARMPASMSADAVKPDERGEIIVDQALPGSAYQSSAYFLTTPRQVISATVTLSKATGISHVILHVGSPGPPPNPAQGGSRQ